MAEQKSDEIVVETEAPVEQICRATLPSLISALQDLQADTACSWNVVDATEVLMDAGQYLLARKLSARVADLLESDGRGRLFTAYALFCEMMSTGVVRANLRAIERTRSLLFEGGHSVPDLVRGGVLLARAKVFGVAVGCLPDIELAEARSLLSLEYDRATADGHHELAFSVALELAKLHIHAPFPDRASAKALLWVLKTQYVDLPIRGDLRFDLERLLYQVDVNAGEGKEAPSSEKRPSHLQVMTFLQLEEFARELGPLSVALAHLAQSRSHFHHDPSAAERLERAYDVFTHNGFLLGAFEISYKRGSVALAEQHVAKAERCFRGGHDHATVGGFMHAAVTSVLGLYQCAVVNGSTDGARKWISAMMSMRRTELAQGTIGLSLVAAHQLLGDFREGQKIAASLEKFFTERGLAPQASHAAFAQGACAAGIGDWGGAERAWQRSLRLDEQRGDVLSSTDRRAAVAQAITMREFLRDRVVSTVTMAKVHKFLQEAQDGIAAVSVGPELIRTEAKLLQTRAQLCIVAQQPVEALKFLNHARLRYVALNAQRECALVDSMSGLALLEVGKLRNAQIYDEASAALHRALEFFDSKEQLAIRWKLKYYLCVAAYMNSQSKPKEEDRYHWRATAAAWLRDALNDVGAMQLGEGALNAIQLEGDFSPGLKPEVLEPLKKVMGLDTSLVRVKKSRNEERARSRRVARQMH
jgi:hypothetical protein